MKYKININKLILPKIKVSNMKFTILNFATDELSPYQIRERFNKANNKFFQLCKWEKYLASLPVIYKNSRIGGNTFGI